MGTTSLIELSLSATALVVAVLIKASLVIIQTSIEYTIPSCVLRHRTYIWIRQISFSFIIGLSIGIAIINNEVSLHSIISMCTLSLFLAIDGINHIHSPPIKKRWCLPYALSLLYYICRATQSAPIDLIILSVYILGFLFTVVEVVRPRISVLKFEPPLEFTCDLLSYVSFSYLTPILITPALHPPPLTLADLPELVDTERAMNVHQAFTALSQSSSSSSLGARLLSLVLDEWLRHGVCQLLSSSALVLSPIALRSLLWHLEGQSVDGEEDPPFGLTAWAAVGLLAFGPLLKAVADNQTYMRGRHVGVRPAGGNDWHQVWRHTEHPARARTA